MYGLEPTPVMESATASPRAAQERQLNALIVMPVAEQRGGCEMMLAQLMEHGRNLGITWSVLFLEHGPLVEQFESLGIRTRVVRLGRTREVHRSALVTYEIHKEIRRQRVDVVLGWMTKSHLLSGPAAMIAGVPALWFQHGAPTRRSKIDVAASLVPAVEVFACSRMTASAQEKLWPGRDTFVVNPAVDLSKYDPRTLPSMREARKQLELPLDAPLIGIVGRLQRWKGAHTLIKAMPRLLQSRPDLHCVIVGGEHSLEADYKPFLDELVRSLGLENRVIFAGLRHDIPLWMQAMDVMVHASHNEPFGMVVIEAMALGKPVVAGSQGGPTEIITPEVDGLLTPYGNADALAQAIERYLSDSQFAQNIGRAAAQRAQYYSIDRYVNLVAARLKAVCGAASEAA
jgi:glycosyltransferase involved in cell wall biosynthesis